MELTREDFRAMIYYDFRRGLSSKNTLINLFPLLAMKPILCYCEMLVYAEKKMLLNQ